MLGPHVARVCRDFLANNNIVPLDWPPYSVDLSPIEHLWDDLENVKCADIAALKPIALRIVNTQ